MNAREAALREERIRFSDLYGRLRAEREQLVRQIQELEAKLPEIDRQMLEADECAGRCEQEAQKEAARG